MSKPSGAPQVARKPVAQPRRYAFLLLVTFLNVLNFVDRQLLASFANCIVPELGFSFFAAGRQLSR